MNKTQNKLNLRDFTYVYEPGIGQTYQNGAYMILVGARSYYAASYLGRTIAYNLRDILAAVEACAAHERVRPK